MAQFVITDEMLKGFFAKGLKASEMAEEITKLSGTKCSPATVKKACQHYGLDLKKKARKSEFVFEDSCGGQGCIITELPNDQVETNVNAEEVPQFDGLAL